MDLNMDLDLDLPSSWDALRKQARKLEAQLDEQINSYRKLVATKVETSSGSSDTALVLESGIQHLLKQLDLLNFQMRAWVSSAGSEMVSHTLTRHQEILQDLTQEFFRLRSGLRAKQQHASLLQHFRDFDPTRVDLDAPPHSSLLKEHASITRNTAQACIMKDLTTIITDLGKMDSVISQAQSTLGVLVLQRSTFGGINSKISNVSSRLPTVNQILASIKRRKSMDTIILSLVASVCAFLIFIYWLSK